MKVFTSFNNLHCGLRVDELRTNSKTADNKGLPQWGLTCFVDGFVVNQTFVLRMNSGANNPPLRQAPKRYLQPLGDTANPNFTALNKQF